MPRRGFLRAVAGRGRQSGIAALAVTVLLVFAMLLGIGFVNRNLIFEQRASANQYRATQAFEAAEAGLEWAVARLADNQRIGSDCLPSTDAAAPSFRNRHLGWSPTSAAFSPLTWQSGGVAIPVQPACVRAEAGWICSCPAANAASLVVPATLAPAPAFSVRFQAAAQPGLVRIVVVGCSSLGGPCAPGAGGGVDATATVQALLGLVPALRTAPAAALTVRGDVGADAGGLGVHNRDAASGGLALHAGGAVGALPARTSAPAGAPSTAAIADHDAVLAGSSADRFVATYLGLDRERWAAQPMVRRVACSGDCTLVLQTAIASDDGASMVHIEGDADLVGPASFGSPDRPVLIVARGALRLHGAVTVVGVLHGGSVAWSSPAASGARVRGAVLSESDYGGDGTPDIAYDADVLLRLRREAGLFTRVAGSWRDF